MVLVLFVFLFKQKTAYEMRISDWSSDVCSSDLRQFPTGRRADSHLHLSSNAFVIAALRIYMPERRRTAFLETSATSRWCPRSAKFLGPKSRASRMQR